MRHLLVPFTLLQGCTPPGDEDSAEPSPTCNGHLALCDRPLNEVTFPATHNSMSNEEAVFQLPNQPRTLAHQLDDGVRGFLLDTHEGDDGQPALCHGYCALGSTPLVDGLTVFREFLDAHPREVLIFIVEDYVTPEATAAAFDAADLTRLTYTWDGGEWPTLGELAAADTRLLVTSESGAAGVDWYQPAWSLFVDTPYDFNSVDEFSCAVNRGSPENPLFLLNHWVEDPIPEEALAEEANTADVLGGRAEECAAAFGHNPTLVAVDWYTAGDLFAVVDELNGLE